MPYLDNPAGRLHDLLTRLTTIGGNQQLVVAWAQVLRVQEDDVVLRLGAVADLVRQIQEAVDNAGEPALVRPVQRYRRSWSNPIFPSDHAFSARAERVFPDEVSLEALDLVSAQLHRTAPDGVVPDEGELARMRSQLEDLVAEVRESDEIPDEVKHVLIARLHEVEEALDQLAVGGPRAVSRAMEAVVGALIVQNDPKVLKSKAIRRLGAVLFVMFEVFTAGPRVQASIDAWHDMAVAAIEAPASPAKGSPTENGAHARTTAPADPSDAGN
ncbi:MAG TPA: hypothetical protein VGM91_19355 [Conexibacter sp.]